MTDLRPTVVGARVRFRDDHELYPGMVGTIHAFYDFLDPPEVGIILDGVTARAEDIEPHVDVDKCPDCNEKGRWDGRVMIGGRGIYTCPNGHRWQDATEKTSNKGVPLATPEEPWCPEHGYGCEPSDCPCGHTLRCDCKDIANEH